MAANGAAPGTRTFEAETGIRRSEWLGVYWARWGDAVREAGIQANTLKEKISPDVMFGELALAARHFGHVPNAAERRLYARSHSAFPSHTTFDNHFEGKADMLRRFHEWLQEKPEFLDVAALVAAPEEIEAPRERTSPREGWVYLIKWGAHHKIGRGDQLERRVRQVQVSLPEKGDLVHAIRTDDPVGIEAYWHSRFADRRANGEWFKLTTADITAFKRRKYQ